MVESSLELRRHPISLSVAMATYNGERFLIEQLDSILSQLGPNDELVIVDDASQDSTCALIDGLCDSRIRLIQNETNQGVLASFETALHQATGEIVFLSDQDDIWLANKVTTVLQAFCSNPDITMVVSDAILVDQRGTLVAPSYYAQRGQFSDRFFMNLIRCKYLGCTMAFRAEVLQKALPFPSSRFLLHDVWIGVVNRLSGGKTQYLTDPLVCYRRHDSAVTGIRRLSAAHRTLLRLHLVYAAAGFWLRHHLVGSR
jgi:glycosyltransferase involved in cell wall biosynthesis